MKTQGQNLFIISKTPQVKLQKHLEARFGVSLEIQLFDNPDVALSRVDATTEFVVIDTDPHDNLNSRLILRIKRLNPKTEVIVLTSDHNVAEAIQLFRQGAGDVVIKGRSSYYRIADKIAFILLQPLRLLNREFKVSKFLSVQFLVFLTMGIVVLITLIYTTYTK